MAACGTGAIFRFDREGLLRFDAEWTRDAWGRHPGPHTPGWRWNLARDRDSGFVQLVLVTATPLLEQHPRLDVLAFDHVGTAQAALAALGSPPLRSAPW